MMLTWYLEVLNRRWLVVEPSHWNSNIKLHSRCRYVLFGTTAVSVLQFRFQIPLFERSWWTQPGSQNSAYICSPVNWSFEGSIEQALNPWNTVDHMFTIQAIDNKAIMEALAFILMSVRIRSDNYKVYLFTGQLKGRLNKHWIHEIL